MKSKPKTDLIAASLLTMGMMGWLLTAAADPGAASDRKPAPPTEVEAEAPGDPADPGEVADPTAEDAAWQPAVDAKPLSTSARRGLTWLVAHQQQDGGWGQGEESSRMGGRGAGASTGLAPAIGSSIRLAPPTEPAPDQAVAGDHPELVESPSNVADTAMAALALLRGAQEAELQTQAEPAPADRDVDAGDTEPSTLPNAGDTDGDTDVDPPALPEQVTEGEIDSWQQAVRRGARFICTHIEQADDESLAITDLRGTRLQQKIGAYVDTFVAALFLTEYRQTLSGSDEDYERVTDALEKVMAKIQAHQQEDGSWAAGGWAGDLSLSIAGKAVNRAAQSGLTVAPEVLERVAASGNADFDRASGAFRVGRSAGIELYAASKSVAQLQDTANTFETERAELERAVAAPASEQDLQRAQDRLTVIEGNQSNLTEARGEVVRRLRTDERFVAGFGTNGGEEFLSYMNLGESLVIAGGEAWEEWDRMITTRLTQAQNRDGSWSGHHCITGRTFCTSAALLVLMVDRAPVPVVATAD